MQLITLLLALLHALLQPPHVHAASRSHVRAPLPHRHAVVRHTVRHIEVTPWHRWAHGGFALKVTGCEAPDGPTELDNNAGVYYFGKWQMNEDFVRTYGHVNPWHYVRGGRFYMPEDMQDRIGWHGWLARGWQPWACASMV